MTDNLHDYFMGQALLEAQKAMAQDEVPVGGVMVYRDKIIGRTHNLCEKLCDFTAHTEMSLFTSASDYLSSKYLNDCTLYVTLEPCIMCAGASFWTRIGTIVYGASDSKRGFTSVSPCPLHPKTNILSGIREMECSNLITDFFKTKRLKPSA